MKWQISVRRKELLLSVTKNYIFLEITISFTNIRRNEIKCNGRGKKIQLTDK